VDPPIESTKPAPRRRWFQFSLRTLLLAALLAGSAELLWFHRAPWRHYATVNATQSDMSDFSPDGRRFYVCVDAGIKLYNADTGTLIGDLNTSGSPVCVSFSPDCKTIATLTDSGFGTATPNEKERCQVWDAGTGAEIHHFREPGFASNSMSYSAAGKHLLFLNSLYRGAVIVAAANEGKILNSMPDSFFSSNGRSIWTISNEDPAVFDFYDSDTLAKTCSVATRRARSESFVSMDGSLLFTRFNDGELPGIWDTRSGEKLVFPQMTDHNWRCNGVYSPRDRFVTYDQKNGSAGVYVWNRRSKKLEHTLSGRHTATFLMASEDAYLDADKGEVLDLDSGQVLFQFAWSKENFPGPDLSQSLDGQRVASWYDSETLYLYRKQRPYGWQGFLSLPEFWTTLLLAIALLWSLRRDRSLRSPNTV
jgi:hypothetical protein